MDALFRSCSYELMLRETGQITDKPLTESAILSPSPYHNQYEL
jgi:hypothetical protein